MSLTIAYCAKDFAILASDRRETIKGTDGTQAYEKGPSKILQLGNGLLAGTGDVGLVQAVFDRIGKAPKDAPLIVPRTIRQVYEKEGGWKLTEKVASTAFQLIRAIKDAFVLDIWTIQDGQKVQFHTYPLGFGFTWPSDLTDDFIVPLGQEFLDAAAQQPEPALRAAVSLLKQVEGLSEMVGDGLDLAGILRVDGRLSFFKLPDAITSDELEAWMEKIANALSEATPCEAAKS